MSHFTTIETQVRDIPALREACRELGVELLENTTARGYNHNTLKGELVMDFRSCSPDCPENRMDSVNGRRYIFRTWVASWR